MRLIKPASKVDAKVKPLLIRNMFTPVSLKPCHKNRPFFTEKTWRVKSSRHPFIRLYHITIFNGRDKTLSLESERLEGYNYQDTFLG